MSRCCFFEKMWGMIKGLRTNFIDSVGKGE